MLIPYKFLSERKAEIFPVILTCIPILEEGHFGLNRREAVELVDYGKGIFFGMRLRDIVGQGISSGKIPR